MRRALVLFAALCLVAASVALSAPAQAKQVRWRAVITFDKSQQHPDDSRLEWKVLHRDGAGVWRTHERRVWRAGAGMLGRSGTNPCVRNQGWLPNGSYHVRLYDNYDGSLIKGRTLRLDDKRCANGTLRQNLFVHTEQGPRNVQCLDKPGDQVCRWEYPSVNDYKSAGCIKLSPGDLAGLARRYHAYFHSGVRYSLSRVKLRVVD